MVMCSSCNGTGQCEFCEGRGTRITAEVEGRITLYQAQPCAVCVGSGKCPSCSPGAALAVIKQPTIQQTAAV